MSTNVGHIMATILINKYLKKTSFITCPHTSIHTDTAYGNST